jgi:hypothetical protein
MAMFGGVALVQWLSGVAASAYSDHGGDPQRAALLTVALSLLLGAIGFWRLPGPKTV